MIKKHECYDPLHVWSDEKLLSVYREFRTIIKNSLEVLRGIKEFENDEIDEFDLMDIIEDNKIKETDAVREYGKFACSTIPAINRNMARTVVDITEDDSELQPSEQQLVEKGYLTKYIDFCTMLVDRCAGVTEEEKEYLKDVTVNLIANSSYALRYDFGIQDTVNSLEELEGNVVKCDVDSITYAYCKKYNIPIDAEASAIITVANRFKPKLPLFDEYPELEDIFENVMGPFLADIDPDLLTIDIVMQVVNGEVLAEDVYKLFVKDKEND